MMSNKPLLECKRKVSLSAEDLVKHGISSFADMIV